MSNREYKVEDKSFQYLADARDYAESIMASRHDDDWVDIRVKEEDENFFEPYGEVVRERGRFILKR